jgi:hypothetical protein
MELAACATVVVSGGLGVCKNIKALNYLHKLIRIKYRNSWHDWISVRKLEPIIDQV